METIKKTIIKPNTFTPIKEKDVKATFTCWKNRGFYNTIEAIKIQQGCIKKVTVIPSFDRLKNL